MNLKWYQILIFTAIIVTLAIISLPRSREHGLMLKSAGKGKKAEQFLLKSLAKNPHDEKVIMSLFDIFTKNQEQKKAFFLLQKYFNPLPEKVKLRQKILDFYILNNYTGQAIALLQKNKERNDSSEKKLLKLYEKVGRIAEIIAIYKKKLKGGKEDSKHWQTILRLERWRNNVPGIADALEKLGKLEPTEETYFQLLQLYQWQGKTAKALKAAAKLQALARLKPETLRALMTLYLQQRNLPGALRAARRISKSNKASVQDCLDLSALLGYAEQKQAAFRQLQRGLQLYPQSLKILRQLAYQSFLRKDKSTEAKYQFRIATLSNLESDWKEAALAFMAVKQNQKARKILLRLTAKPKAEAGTLLLLAELELKEKNAQNALEVTNRLQQKFRQLGNPDISFISRMAEVFRQTGKSRKYLKLLEKIGQKQPHNQDALFALITGYGEAGDFKKVKEFIEVASMLPGIDQKRLRREIAWMHLRDLYKLSPTAPGLATARKNTAQALNAALKDDPANSEFILTLAEIYNDLEKPARAEKLSTRLKFIPVSFKLGLAYSYLRKKQKTKALKIYAKLLQEKDTTRELKLTTANLYGEIGKYAEQYKIMDQLAASGNDKDWLAAAKRRRWHNQPKKALAVLLRGRKLFPDSTLLMARIIPALAGNNKLKQALQLRRRLIAQGGKLNNEALFELAEELAKIKEFTASRDFYKLLLQRDSLHAGGNLGLARLYASNRERGLASKYFLKYLALNNNDGRVWYELGENKYEAGTSGKNELLKARRFLSSNRSSEMLEIKAHIEYRLGQTKTALGLYHLAINKNPDDFVVACDLVQILIEQNMLEEAEFELEKIIAARPEHIRARRQRAVCYLQRGKPKPAKELLLKLHQSYPDDKVIITDLAFAEDLLGNKNTAERYYRIITQQSEGQRP